VLDVKRSTAEHPARLLRNHRIETRTRKGRRALGCFKQAALERAKAASLTHVNLDGTVIRTDRVAAPGPNGADLWWSGKHKHHGGNVQVISTPDGWPLWVSPVRPGREHDTTCARHHGLIDALNRIAVELNMPTLTDLGYENAGDGFRHPVKRQEARRRQSDRSPANRTHSEGMGLIGDGR
jgi:hypothetical protein